MCQEQSEGAHTAAAPPAAAVNILLCCVRVDVCAVPRSVASCNIMLLCVCQEQGEGAHTAAGPPAAAVNILLCVSVVVCLCSVQQSVASCNIMLLFDVTGALRRAGTGDLDARGSGKYLAVSESRCLCCATMNREL